jgi:flagellar basal-body rod protein FlgC
MDEIMKSLQVSAAGMRAQATRVRIVAENLANADSLPMAPGEVPYRRRVVGFRSIVDATTGAKTVEVARVRHDPSPFPTRYDPSHPGANADGYLAQPNVNTLIEMADMREAQRSYEANLNVVRNAKTMLQETIDVLR